MPRAPSEADDLANEPWQQARFVQLLLANLWRKIGGLRMSLKIQGLSIHIKITTVKLLRDITRVGCCDSVLASIQTM